MKHDPRDSIKQTGPTQLDFRNLLKNKPKPKEEVKQAEDQPDYKSHLRKTVPPPQVKPKPKPADSPDFRAHLKRVNHQKPCIPMYLL